MQLTGVNVGGDVVYRVIYSNLQVPLKTELYLSCTVRLSPKGDSTAHFVWKNLGDPDSKVYEAVIEHDVKSLTPNATDPLLLGGRATNQHFWNGNLKRLLITSPALDKNKLLLLQHPETGKKMNSKLDLDFAKSAEELLSKANFHPLSSPEANKPSSPRLEALTALCHAVLTSNEFLYLH